MAVDIIQRDFDAVLVLFPPLRAVGADQCGEPGAERDKRIVSLAAALLGSGDAFAQEFLAAKHAARLQGIRRAATQ